VYEKRAASVEVSTRLTGKKSISGIGSPFALEIALDGAGHCNIVGDAAQVFAVATV
jgi:hypothetical protein